MNNKKECFICLETDDYVYNLSSLNKLYWKNCVCNSDIHTNCLEKWLSIKKRCPICNTKYIYKLSWCKTKILTILHFITKCILVVTIVIVIQICSNVDVIFYSNLND